MIVIEPIYCMKMYSIDLQSSNCPVHTEATWSVIHSGCLYSFCDSCKQIAMIHTYWRGCTFEPI